MGIRILFSLMTLGFWLCITEEFFKEVGGWIDNCHCVLSMAIFVLLSIQIFYLIWTL